MGMQTSPFASFGQNHEVGSLLVVLELQGPFLLLIRIRFCALLSLLTLAFSEKIFLLSAPFNLNLSQLPLEVFAF